MANLPLQARALILGEVPQAAELLYDSYNAVSAAYSYSDRLSHVFCYVATYTRHLNLGFNQEADLNDPNGVLQGSGERIRHVRIDSADDLESPYVRDVIRRAAVKIEAEGAPLSRTLSPDRL